ncbi:MAG: hypothetical protein IJQ66_04680 [Clostridia bacterium]|nr:hypothetical protein [Clostridia bacterium]
MEISEELKREFIKRLIISRTRLLCNHPFFGLLLMGAGFRLDETLETAATDGENIIFGVEFLKELSDKELDFVLMHEIMHVALSHCFRGENLSQEAFNIACDIVVNSNILAESGGNPAAISLKKWGVSMHLAPNGKEGALYTAEEVYEMLPAYMKKDGEQGAKTESGGFSKGRAKKEQGKAADRNRAGFDDHSRWKDSFEEDDTVRDVWAKRVEEAAKAIEIREAYIGRGLLPLFAKRLLKELKEPSVDWRTILADFVQEKVVDYSFVPPDRRFGDADFYLPDFNGTEIEVKNVLFMIDTSGSMSDDMVTQAYSEVKGAIDQFDGKLQGFLGFFDAAIIEPQPFCDENSFKMIKPAGGGGTDFQIIFEYVKKNMADDLPASIIILTDGLAPFPQEKLAMDIPVLWVINNDTVTPPWGKVARIKNRQ